MNENIFGPMPDFSKAKIGDKCWSRKYGPGKIIEKDDSALPVYVEFLSYKYCREYSAEGRHKEELRSPWPELFHSQPALLIPPKAVVRPENIEAYALETDSGLHLSWTPEGEFKPGTKTMAAYPLRGTRTIREPQEWEVVEGWIALDNLSSFQSLIGPYGRPVISCQVIGFRPKEKK